MAGDLLGGSLNLGGELLNQPVAADYGEFLGVKIAALAQNFHNLAAHHGVFGVACNLRHNLVARLCIHAEGEGNINVAVKVLVVGQNIARALVLLKRAHNSLLPALNNL